MKGKEFTKRVKKYAKANNIAFELTSQGKGGHQTIHLGSKRTTVKTGEIKQGLLVFENFYMLQIYQCFHK